MDRCSGEETSIGHFSICLMPLPPFLRGPLLTEGQNNKSFVSFSHDPHSSLAGSSRICTCLKCLSNCRCMVLIAASGFLANPGPPNVKYVSQLEHLPCSPDLSFWVISRCGFFMNQVCHSQDSRSTPVNFKPHHRPRSPGLGEQSSPAPPQ